MKENKSKLLDSINYPEDLRKLEISQLPEVCRELRQFIIDEVSCNPGHLGANLGVVELTVALHYIYQTPYDLLVWDVGHQAYGHKILTGRRNVFNTNRKYHGISGFPRRSESIYDTFGVGHSSTSISAALGMAVASQLNGQKDRKIVAVIGDGSMTGGMAFEGLNNAGINQSDLLVILNDNNMAIDPNVGGMSQYLLDITRSETYNKFKKDVWDGLGKIYGVGHKARKLMQRTENILKTIILKRSNMFEALGFRYFGPIDGHDVVYLTKVLHDMRRIPGPKLLHIITQKGKGFSPAEKNQTIWHAPGLFDKNTGLRIVEKEIVHHPKYQEVFGQTMVELATLNEKVVAITPAMSTGCSLNLMKKKFPNRTFDVGIAEQHAVTFSAGLATQGLIPYCNVYSTFMQRAYDQIIHDVALQNLHVVFCLDRGGLVGADGATHHGVFDLAYMRSIPNMTVAAPMDEIELRQMLYTFQAETYGPVSIRYPRGKGIHTKWEVPFEKIEVGKGRVIHEGNQLAFLTIGQVGNFALKAIEILEEEGFSIALYDMRFVKPLDEEILQKTFTNFEHIITIEDGAIEGGFGSAVIEWANEKGFNKNVTTLGIPDHFIDQGSLAELYKECKFDIPSICEKVRELLKENQQENTGYVHLTITGERD